MNYNRTTEEKLEEVSRKILAVSRNELYMKMRFLDVALSSLVFVMDIGADGLGTDGLYLYYNPQYLGGLYRDSRIEVNRRYLHLVLHGIFRHMIRRNGRMERLYDLSCDIVTESMIDSMQHRCLLKSRSLLRRETYRKLEKERKVLTAEKVYGSLREWKMNEQELGRLEQEFRMDDHSYWPKDDEQKKQSQIENQWQSISEQMETDMETFSQEASSASGDLAAQVRVENREI